MSVLFTADCHDSQLCLEQVLTIDSDLTRVFVIKVGASPGVHDTEHSTAGVAATGSVTKCP